MTTKDIMHMAQDSGVLNQMVVTAMVNREDLLTRFAEMVAAKVREESTK